MLERPARLLVRIGDRLRIARLVKRLDESPVPEPVRKQVKESLALADAAKNDFAAALAHCATVEKIDELILACAVKSENHEGTKDTKGAKP